MVLIVAMWYRVRLRSREVVVDLARKAAWIVGNNRLAGNWS